MQPITLPRCGPAAWRRPLVWLTLALVTLVLTWPGLGQGLGHSPEELRRLAIAVQMVSSGDPNPHWFGHPATLLIHLQAALLWIAHWFLPDRDVRALYLSEPGPLIVGTRVLARLAGVAAVIATYELARPALGSRWALLAGGLTALNPLFILYGHRGRADHILSLILVLAVAALIALQRQPGRRGITRLALLTGLGITFKYSAGGVLLAGLAALAARCGLGRAGLRRLALLAGLTLLVTVVASPFLFLDWRASLSGLSGEVTKQGGWTPHHNLIRTAQVLLYAYHPAGAGLLALGAGRGLLACWRGGPAGLRRLVANPEGALLPALVLVGLVQTMPVLLASAFSPTWLGPLVPLCTLVIVSQLAWLWRRLRSWGTGPALLATALPLLAMVAQQLPDVALLRWIRQQPQPTTARAEAWLASRLRPGQRVLLLQGSFKSREVFPRVRVPGVVLLAATDAGPIQIVCPGERGDRFALEGSLIHDVCYPRPFLRSLSRRPLVELLHDHDAIVVASSNPLTPDISAWLDAVPAAAVFRRPTPPGGRPSPILDTVYSHGDFGVWTEVRVYLRQGVSPAVRSAPGAGRGSSGPSPQT